jgi:hypothetical protein
LAVFHMPNSLEQRLAPIAKKYLAFSSLQVKMLDVQLALCLLLAVFKRVLLRSLCAF